VLVALLVLTVIGTLVLAADRPLAETVRIQDGAVLIEQGKVLDGKDVVFDGEVIGDIMRRGDHAWINVLSNGTAIGVWITEQQRALINLTGHFDVIGDRVQITGVFHRACVEHGGDLDIHADSLQVIQDGIHTHTPLDIRRLLVAAVLLLLACISLAWLFWPRSNRGRRRIN